MRIGAAGVWCQRDGETNTCNLLRIGTHGRRQPVDVIMKIPRTVVQYGIAERPDWFPLYGVYQVMVTFRLVPHRSLISRDHSTEMIQSQMYSCFWLIHSPAVASLLTEIVRRPFHFTCTTPARSTHHTGSAALAVVLVLDLSSECATARLQRR